MTNDKQYDNNDFFKAYSQMSRSIYGLNGAGEWETFRENLPPLKNKMVLDLGCGYGWHCKYIADQGATKVIGIDSSEKMIAQAKKINSAENIEYRVQSILDLDFPSQRFDLVISSLVLHYIEDIHALFQSIHPLLTENGILLITVEHPLFTAEGSQDWVYKDDQISHFPVDNYFIEGERHTHFLGAEIKKYHHTLTSYFTALKNSHFTVETMVEPMPPENMMTIAGMQDELRRPMMLIIKASKKLS